MLGMSLVRDFSAPDNPNPNADIGFVIFYPFQFYVLKDIYKQLESRSEFIIDLGAFFPIRQSENLLQATLELLRSHGVKYRILWHSNYFSSENLRVFFLQYHGLVAMWERGCLTRSATRDIKKICATYGVGKELTMVRPSRGLYDLILAYGPRDQKLFAYYTESKISGNPKFDDWFSGKVSESAITAIRLILDPNKKTLLYLPTHSDLSSVDLVATELGRLRKEYNVIVKMHYFLAHEEPERVELLRKEKLIIYGDETDILPIFKVADVVLSDNSSAIFDAMLADKPLVLVDFLDTEYLDLTHKNRRQYRRGVNTALTFSGSIEQEIKRDGRVITFSNPVDMRARIAEALEDKAYYRQERKKLVAELFSYNDGKCGERAAKMILDCIAEVSPKQRPILYHAIEAYKTRIGLSSYAYKYETEGQLAVYRHQISVLGRENGGSPTFSVIVVDTGEGLRETLSAVAWQEYPVDRYEIVVMSLEPRVGEGCAYVPGRSRLKPDTKIRFEFYSGSSMVSDRLAVAISSSNAEWIGFTRSGCVPSSDWLLRYILHINGLSFVVGIGGYEMLTPETGSNRFMRYEHYLIAKKLGTHTSLRRYAWTSTVINSLPLVNPFGSLSNSFYRREVLLQIDILGFGARSWATIETLIRWLAVKHGALAFVPIGVRRFIGPNAFSFRVDSFDQGFAHGLIRRSRSQVLSRFSPQEGIRTILGEVVVALSGMYAPKSLGLAWTALQATCFRWAGFLVARYQIFVRWEKGYFR